jgi:mitochondrial import receptor subunit TOM40
MGVEFETNVRVQKCVATIGYQIDIPKADLVFRGMVDTDWSIGSVLEKKLTPLPFTLALSGLFNHSENAFQLGCGFIIG